MRISDWSSDVCSSDLLAQITSSTVPLRSLQPACPDSHNPETKLMTLQHAGLAALALAFAIPTAQAQATDYPLSLTNCGQTITFDAAPDSAVTMGQSGTEMLYALGLGKKIVATSVWFNPVLPQFKELNDSKIGRAHV